VRPHPRRIADDHVEPAGAGRVGEVPGEAEGERRAAGERAPTRGELAHRVAQRVQAGAVGGRGAAPPAEQVARPRRAQPLGALGAQAREGAVERGEGVRALRLVEPSRGGELAGPDSEA
jgi:hypothetical protein